MDVLAVVTARGGSKGIPRKNLVPFLGQPLLFWSVRAGLEANSVTRTIVSTDDPEIAEAGSAAGAEVPFMRPGELAGDTTPDLPVFLHALEWLDRNEGYQPQIIVHLRPTTPLRPAGLIDRAVGMLVEDDDADSVRSVCAPQNNPFKMWRLTERYMEPLFDSGIREQYNRPRQELPAAYWQTGTVDVTRSRTLLDKGSMTGSRILPLVMDAAIAVDIDDEESLRSAEKVCRREMLAEVQ